MILGAIDHRRLVAAVLDALDAAGAVLDEAGLAALLEDVRAAVRRRRALARWADAAGA